MTYAMDVISGFWAGALAGLIVVLIVLVVRLGGRGPRP